MSVSLPSPLPSVALVCSEILGPYLGGGIATSVFGLAAAIKSRAQVTVIYLGGYAKGWDAERAIRFFGDLGITFVDPRQPFEDPERTAPVPFELWDARTRSFLALEELRRLRPDLAVFHEYGGLGFYPVLDKAQNGALSGTRMMTVLHGPSRWARTINAELSPDRFTFVQDHMEKVQVELSDHVSSPSQYIFDWCLREGWSLDAARHSVERNVVPLHPIEHYLSDEIAADRFQDPDAPSLRRDVSEFVFFGRLEQRKGVIALCDALDRLSQLQRSLPEKVTFLGKPSVINGFDSTAYVVERSGKWPFEIEFIEGFNQSQALDYLSGAGRLALMPSTEENAPCVVVECLNRGIPMLCALGGGTGELVAEADRGRIALPLPRNAMAERLADALDEGVPLAHLSYTHAEAIAAWCARIDAALAMPLTAPEPLADAPLVSVVVTHFNRTDMLRDGLKAILAQDYENIEIIVVDDGSRASVRRELHAAWGDHPKIRIIEQENAYLGAARNTGIRAAQGVYVKFMDDDNIPLPCEISELVRAAEATGADVVTCFSQMFSVDRPETEADIDGYYFPLGGGGAVNLFSNYFGDANALCRRSALEELGGFTEDYGIGFEDFELFLKAGLMGHRTTVVPRPLFWYRVSEGSMLQSGQRPDMLLRNRTRITRVFRALADRLSPEVVADLVELTSADILRAETDYARNALWTSALPDHMKRLRSGSVEPQFRQGDLVRLMISKGRMTEAVRYVGGHIPDALAAEFSDKLIAGASFISASSMVSDNRITNPTFDGLTEGRHVAPYDQLCPGWYVPQAQQGPSHFFLPVVPGAEDGPEVRPCLQVAITEPPVAWHDGAYLLMRTEMDARGFALVDGLNTLMEIRSLGDPFRLDYFVRVHRGDDFVDYWSHVDVSDTWTDASDFLRFDRADERPIERLELFLQIYFLVERRFEIGRVESRVCGRVDWRTPERVSVGTTR